MPQGLFSFPAKQRPRGFLRQDTLALALNCTTNTPMLGWRGTSYCSMTESEAGSFPKLGFAKKVLRFPKVAELFSVKISRHFVRVSPDPQTDRLVVLLTECA